MPTAEGCAGRRRRLWDALPSPCDALVINDPRHLTYLAGYAPSPFTFRTASGGAVLVLFPDRSVLVGDNLLRPFLDEAHVDEIAAPTWYDGRTSPEARDDVLWSAVIDLLARGGVVHLGVERTRRTSPPGKQTSASAP
jgi:Xaa-Pro aminopeptidase